LREGEEIISEQWYQWGKQTSVSCRHLQVYTWLLEWPVTVSLSVYRISFRRVGWSHASHQGGRGDVHTISTRYI